MLRKNLTKFNYLAYIRAESFVGKEVPIEEELHASAVNSVLRLREFVPNEYKHLNLERILVSKALTYNTSIDKSLRQFHYLYKALYKALKVKTASKIVSKTIMDLKEKRLDISRKLKTFEDGKIFSFQDGIFSSHKDSETDLLFFASQPSHLNVFDCFFKYSNLENFQLLLPYRLKDNFNISNIGVNKIIYFEEFFESNTEIDLKNYKEEFLQIYFDEWANIKDLFQFDDVNLFDSQESGIRNIFEFLFPQSLLYALTSQKILKNKLINKVIGVRPRRIFDRAILQSASNLGIDTNLIIHSTLGSDPRELWSSGLFDNLTNVFGWGEKHAQLIKADSYFKSSNFIKSGSPLFNSPPTKINFTKQNKKLLYASTRNDSSILNSLEKFSKTHPEIDLTIKAHPGELINQNLIRENLNIEPGTFAIEEILNQYDIFITSYSGSHIAAISEGLPVIFAPFFHCFSMFFIDFLPNAIEIL